MTSPMIGVTVGLALGAALLLLGWWARARRSLPLALRIGPYVGIPGTAARSTSRRLSVRQHLRPLLAPRRPADRSLDARLRQAGSSMSPVAFRQRRLIVAAGAAAGAGVLAAGAGGSTGSAVMLTALAAAGGWSGCDWWLGRQVRRRRDVMARQMPVLTDLVALAVSAGAGPVDALESSARAVGEPIAQDVARAGAAVRSGLPVEGALRVLADDVALSSMNRFVEAVLVALETGSPLAEVARAQAADIRVDERRRLMELAGRRDVAMLVPIVFLVLPSVVLVAVYPGLQALRVVLP